MNPEAYEAYLRGRFFWNKRTEAGFRRSLEYFETAIAKDPAFAQAYAGLADAYLLLGGYGFEPQKVAMPKAKAAALKALAIDDRLADAYTSLDGSRAKSCSVSLWLVGSALCRQSRNGCLGFTTMADDSA